MEGDGGSWFSRPLGVVGLLAMPWCSSRLAEPLNLRMQPKSRTQMRSLVEKELNKLRVLSANTLARLQRAVRGALNAACRTH